MIDPIVCRDPRYVPIATADKGRLRWDDSASQWSWVSTGPKLRVVTLDSGLFRVNRVRA